MYDVDDLRAQDDSRYINGEKNMFVTYGDFDEPEEDEPEEEEPDDIEVEYIDANGQLWYVCLTATEKAHLDAIPNYEERLKFLESL